MVTTVSSCPPTLKLDLTGSMRREFAMEVFQENITGNVVCSPVSAMMPLAKLALGVKGRAESEIHEALGTEEKNKVKENFKKLVVHLKELPGVKLTIASRIYVPYPDKSMIINLFRDESKDVFKTDIEEVDYDDYIKAAEIINEYVRLNTKNEINKIIKPKEIPSKTSILIVNAITFAAKWKVPFDGTQDLPFYSTKKRRTEIVPMMTSTSKYFYGKSDELDAELVEVRFEQDHVAMVIVLPNSGNGLRYLIRMLKETPELINEALNNMTEVDVDLAIPKFEKVEGRIDLKEIYETIGLHHIFKRKSGITKIIENKELKVARAIQKCSLKINQENITAEGSSLGGKVLTSRTDTVKFIVSRPFLYYILIKTLNEQLFAGIYNGYEE